MCLCDQVYFVRCAVAVVAEGVSLKPFFQRPTQGQPFEGGLRCRKECNEGRAVLGGRQQMEALVEWDHPPRTPRFSDNYSLFFMSI